MKRCLLSLAGLLSMFATGCCCTDCCNPCGNSCGPCGSTYGAPYAAPAGAYYAPSTAPVVSAVPVSTTALPGTYVPVTAAAPLESLPTY